MQWIITVDHISARVSAALGDSPSTYADKKLRAKKDWLAAYRAASPEERATMLDAFKASMTEEFRLYDDDGELYYEGLCLNLDDQDEEGAFDPLNWAMNNDGCTTMKYRKKGHAIWKTL